MLTENESCCVSFMRPGLIIIIINIKTFSHMSRDKGYAVWFVGFFFLPERINLALGSFRTGRPRLQHVVSGVLRELSPGWQQHSTAKSSQVSGATFLIDLTMHVANSWCLKIKKNERDSYRFLNEWLKCYHSVVVWIPTRCCSPLALV